MSGATVGIDPLYCQGLPQGKRDEIGTINAEDLTKMYLGENCVPKFVYPYPIGTKVTIDGGDIQAVVNGYCLRADHYRISCTWWFNAEPKEEWFDPKRVKLA